MACAITGTLHGHRHRDSRWPVTAASWPTIPRPGSACPRSWWGSSRRRRDDALFRAWWAPWPPPPVLLEGKTLEPKKAKGAGLVDEVVPADEIAGPREGMGCCRPPTQISSSRGTRKAGRCPAARPITRRAPFPFMTFVGASAMIQRQDQGRLPGGQGAVVGGLRRRALSISDTALKIEARWFTNVLMNPSLLGDDPVALPQQAGAGEGREPPRGARPAGEETGDHGRGHDGRGHRYVSANCRDRGGADRRGARGRRPRKGACRGVSSTRG